MGSSLSRNRESGVFVQGQVASHPEDPGANTRDDLPVTQAAIETEECFLGDLFRGRRVFHNGNKVPVDRVSKLLEDLRYLLSKVSTCRRVEGSEAGSDAMPDRGAMAISRLMLPTGIPARTGETLPPHRVGAASIRFRSNITRF